jgi:transmembrane sensor
LARPLVSNSTSKHCVDELIIRFLQGEASEAEERELRQWRRASLDHERQYRQIERVWSLAGRAQARAAPRPVPAAADLIAGRRLPPHGFQVPTPRSSHARWRFLQAAAAAALILMGFALGRSGGGAVDGIAYGATEFVTGASEMVTARLADGSIIRLGPESRLRVTGMRDTREVWLDGRAFFAVAKDQARPFTVRTRAGEALVLGTRFEVLVEQDVLRVLVVEGRVALEASGEKVEVAAGEASRVVEGAAPTVEKIPDVAPMLDWMGSFLVFESTPLRDAAREIERRYGMRISVPDSALAEQTVTAWFSNQSAEEVLRVICRIVDAHCSIRDSVASIEP